VQLAIAADTPGTHDMELFLHNSFGKEAVQQRSSGRSRIGAGERHHHAPRLHRRRVGDPKRADITNSVTKTFLTTVVGLAWQRGLIKDVNDYVRDYMPPHVDLFERRTTRRSSGSPAASDERLAGHAVGQAGLADRPVARRRTTGRSASCTNRARISNYNDCARDVMGSRRLQVWGAGRCPTCCARK